MSKIKLQLDYIIQDGANIAFNAPCDCTDVDGLIIHYLQSDGVPTSKIFTFRDAHKNDIGDLTDLFVSGALVEIKVDVTNGYAYIKNADTNTYLENKFNTKAPLGLFTERCEVKTFSELEEKMESVYINMPSETFKFVYFTVNGVAYNVQIWKANNNYGMAEISNYSGSSTHRKRFINGGVWGEWEWVNPPMAIDTEYRTVDRWKGKAIYTKLVNFGNIPSSGQRTIEHGIAATQIISACGQASNGMSFPIGTGGSGFYYIALRVGLKNIDIYSDTSEYSKHTATVQIWYTKN